MLGITSLEFISEKTQKKIQILQFFEWKTSKNNKVEQVNESKFIFEIGSKVLNWLTELELLNSTIKVLSKTEKVNIFSSGRKINRIIL